MPLYERIIILMSNSLATRGITLNFFERSGWERAWEQKIVGNHLLWFKSMSMANRLPLQAKFYTRGIYSWFGLHITASRPVSNRKWQHRHSTHSLVPITATRQQNSYSYTYTQKRGDSLHDETIYALSTGSGRAGIAIIRVSGPACLDVCSKSLKHDLANNIDI